MIMTKWQSVALFFAASTLTCGCAASDTLGKAEEVQTTGRLVIVGGALDANNSAVYQSIIDARAGDGPLCVVPTANSDPRASIERAVATFTSYSGAGSVKGILISPANPARAHEPAVAAEFRKCSGFYFTGGSQNRIIDVFLPDGEPTEAYRAIWQRWHEGAVVAGTSAGAAMMSRIMIAGGSAEDAVTHGVVAGSGRDGVQLREGMGFFESGIIDQHFLARGRIGRLLVSVLQQDSPQIGFGIDENTALVVDGDFARVVGVSGVVVVDGRAVQRQGPHRGSGMRVSLVGSGDSIDLKTLAVQRGNAKKSMPVSQLPIGSIENPFARWAFMHLMVDLASSSVHGTSVVISDATLRVVEDKGFSAFMVRAAGGVEGIPAGFSAGPFKVDLLDL
jgi:cyanophycinase